MRPLPAVITVLSACLCAALALARGPRALPVVFHVVHEHGAPVADDAFIAAEIAKANDIFAPLEITFAPKRTLALPTKHASLVTRGDRDALLSYVERGAIHCMVVASLMDIDEPGRIRRGVHWYEKGTTRPHMVILSAIAEPRVLAHELGHYLGLPAHRQVPGNVMSYLWGDGIPIFDPDQAERVQRTVTRMRAQHEL